MAHLKVIQRIEQSVIEGGQFALAMPRGSGKTTLSLIAVIWAVVYGHLRFSMLVGATDKRSVKMAKLIKKMLENTRSVFAEDFPEVVIPCAELRGQANRATGQHCNSERTNIGWNEDTIVLPTIKGSCCSGSVIGAASLLGNIRGMLEMDADNNLIRPDFVILDDPQTKGSAKSAEETKTRLEMIDQDVLGLAGPDGTLSVVMLCTVIEPDSKTKAHCYHYQTIKGDLRWSLNQSERRSKTQSLSSQAWRNQNRSHCLRLHV